MKKIVIGILAHVDSGKTTLSEGMLYCAGEIRKLGRVDHKDAFLDSNSIERDRGITIFSKQALLKYKDTDITLLDTPGHVDFSTEMERTLNVLDYAVLVISGSDGVQSHTQTLWELLIRYNIPVFLFINKMDISHSERGALMHELQNKLDSGCVDFSSDAGTEEFLENISMCDENIMNSFLETGAVDDTLIKDAVIERKIFPCFFGSALKLEGIEEFLDGIDRYTDTQHTKDEFGAKVFKIAEDEQGKRLTYMKITGGSLKVRTTLTGRSRDKKRWSEKVNQIRIYSGEKFQAADEASAGTVCAVVGLSQAYPGEGLGFESDSEQSILEPVLTYSIQLPDGADVHSTLEKLRRLEEEEPALNIIWNERLQEIHVRLMGEVQLDVLKRIISERFGLEIEFGQGSIAYKETIAAPVLGVGHYEPLRHYAEVHLLMEPGERGSGLRFASDCNESVLDKNWQRLVLTHLEEKTHIGVLTGSPITDMKITLVAGRAHKKHTEGGDFRQATYRAVRQGLRSAQSILLEPWYNFKLEIPSEMVGRAMTDIQQMSGTFSPPETIGEMSVISGSCPVSEMRGYSMEVTGYTRGRGRLSCMLKGYEECHNAQEVIEQIGYNSDSDIENTADSVFCSHGAGFNVSWDRAPDYMHVDSDISFSNGDSETEIRDSKTEATKRNMGYGEADKELMEIFERTYGPVKRDLYNIFQTKKSPSEPSKQTYAKKSRIPDGPEYVLVDGYNVIFSWEELKKLARDNLDLARNQLTNRLINYRGYKQCELILVFDAYKVKGNTREVERTGDISIVYTKEAETADMYIEKVTHELGKRHRVRVVTSDNLEQLIILGNGALRIPADAFLQEVEETEKNIRELINKKDI